MSRISEALNVRTSLLALSAAALSLAACTGSETTSATDTNVAGKAESGSSQLSVKVEKYELDNGLDVVLHVDKSDPVVAINLAVHVGSAR